MKVFINIIFTITAITMALTLVTLTVKTSENPPPETEAVASAAGGRKQVVSRFLQQKKERNPRAADHCRKDNEVCNYRLEGGERNATCCNNKCIDVMNDPKNCGACKKKCAFTDTCCGGKCVNLAYDKRHCGSCGNKCMKHGYCFYGICDYA